MHSIEQWPVMSVAGAASWTEFDARWYRETYSRTIDKTLKTDAETLRYYLERGRTIGHSPNPFFDESWYLRTYPDVARAIKSGKFRSAFEHYTKNAQEARQPHWFFDAKFYRAEYRNLTSEGLQSAGFINHYDHFLRRGDEEGRSPSPFFSPGFYLSELDIYETKKAATEGALRHFLRRFRISLPEMQVSPYFDPVWYLRRYPAVAGEVSRGIWRSALDHFLSNSTPQAFDPLPVFSEAYYAQHNLDIAGSINSGKLRSGYEHFIQFGIAEMRRFHPQIDLRRYLHNHPSVLVDLEQNRAPNVFVHFLTMGTIHDLTARSSNGRSSLPAEDEAKLLFRLQAANASLLYSHQSIDFSYSGKPILSVIIVLHNQFSLTLATLSSLRSNYPGALQVIVVDSGSADHTAHIDRFIQGARIIRFKTNVNFVLACNAALTEVEADAVLYLNNDVLLAPGAIEQALRRIHSAPDIGAVGGKVVRTHGLLQEAGNIIWRDGYTTGYQREASPLAPEANFARDVDFCSGVFLMVHTELARKLGGFDVDYAPAYFEETDFCVRARQAGFRVVYDPAIGVQHLEYGSSASSEAARAQMARSHAVFVRKHGAWLLGQPAKELHSSVSARSPRRSLRILFIEDNIPVRFAGSGFVRSNDIVGLMAEMGFDVTVFPINRPDFEIVAMYADFPDTVEVMHNQAAGNLNEFLAARSDYYDILWVGRTHNLEHLKSALSKLRSARQVRVILDTESISAIRHQQRATLADDGLPFDLKTALQAEFKNAGLCDAILAVSEREAQTLRGIGLGAVSVLGHMREVQLTRREFDERHGLLFVGAMHGENSPNYDSLCWFVDHVLDLVEQQIGSDAHLTIIGHTAGDASLARFKDDARITLLGSVADIEPHFDQHRIFVAPTRIAAGLPYKIHEAASLGLPVVASTLLMKQTGWRNGKELLAADTTDPAMFARQIIELYRSKSLWQRLRQGAANRISSEHHRARYRETLRAVLVPAD
ncbi:glycosyl transferase [Kaistia algarum]|uniref:glycosyltransferase n=1 Tax=Kaistia algarum TaxID=2083279 RepID=UPI000CE7F32B|nr:glycosyltransferase [Kaistia algarum]MCX5512538.1 glycosyltransferase [Kaistia algarum]PPE81934.1 glycosyl transferase [Kaistia algarum]